jgi:outer membrane protein OmpA-like peptidoglycan-associated protein/tetratricopeptide (TPR) repeat protein
MKAMRILSSLLLFCLIATVSYGQAAKMKQAQQKMDNLDYMGAIELYNLILEDHDEAQAKINLAEAYRKINDTPNAEYWYGQVVRLPQSEPIHKLYYGMMLQRNGKCDIAREWYQQYVDLVPGDQRGQYLLRACDYEEELMSKSAGIYEVNQCEFNSNSDDFSPQFYKAGLVFTSERDTNPIIRRISTWTGKPFLELYYLDLKQLGNKAEECGNYKFGRPEKFSNEINTKFHDASVAFSKNGEEIFFTRNNYADGKKGYDDEGIMRLKVFYARSEGQGKWGELQSLPFNSNEYSVAHPALSPDGKKLFFASDMPGGFGGLDLYVSEKESGRWGPPMNLGPEVNTEGSEKFPDVAADGRLYFASDGLIGLGGLDIYYITDKGNGIWSAPINMGYPMNTIADDFGIVFNEEGTCGFFSSNRDGGVGGDDICSFKKTAIPVEILVYDEKTDVPLEGAQVVVSCKNDTMTTDGDGKIYIDMKLNDCCDFLASMTDYEPNQMEGCTKDLTLQDKLSLKIPLNKVAEFMVEGIVFDGGASTLPIEGAIVSIENDCGEPLAEPFTTSITGKYYFKLEKDCCYKIKATKEGYFAGIAGSVCTRGLEGSETLRENLYLSPVSLLSGNEPVDVAPKHGVVGEETDFTYMDPETGIWMDKDTRLPADGTYTDERTYEKGVLVTGGPDLVRGHSTPSEEDNFAIPYLLHIYYDFDKSYIRNDAEPELEKLYTLLSENTQYIVEIGSHTDARGSNQYNRRLSQRRAEAVVRWLTDRGIDRQRLVARGYGEAKNVNDCTNNVPCSERKHQMNRRTEFKVIGCLDCIDPAKTAISKENPNVQVDECKSCPF